MFFSMSTNATVVLRPIGDVELWYAEAADGTWRLPVHVEWKQDPSTSAMYALILPGVCFYYVQLQVIGQLLARYAYGERIDRWLIPGTQVPSLLHKAPGIHAEFYYLWPEMDRPPIQSHHGRSVALPEQPSAPSASVSVSASSFAEFIAAEHQLPADVVSVVLEAVAQAGSKWLLKHRRSINLGFVNLVALPFRSNWKEIVMFKGKNRGLIDILCMGKRERRARLAALRFPATLCSPQNIGLRGGDIPNARLDYCIEAIPTKQFENAADQFESERMERGSYVDHYTKAVQHFYETIIECLASYARKVGTAWASVLKSRTDGSLAFVYAKKQPCSFDGVPLTDIPVYIVPAGSDFSVLAERDAGKRQPLQTPASEVQQMPVVLPAAPNVRQSELG